MSSGHKLNVDRSRKKVHPSVFVADTATIVGDVAIGENSSVWFSAVIRGDSAAVEIGSGTSIQDGAIVHGDSNFSVRIGNNVTLGHAAIVHGAVVEDNSLVGIGARVLNGARIGEYCLIAAGAVVLGGTTVPPRSIVVGVPGRITGQVTEENMALIRRTAANYRLARAAYKGEIDPATQDRDQAQGEGANER